MDLDLHRISARLEVFLPWLKIIIIWLLAWVALRLVRRLLHALKTHILGRVDGLRDSRRLETLMSVFRYTANIVVAGLVIMLTLGAIGISITPLLATAGVAGIAIGFGAQTLVKDFFTGLFLLIENQVSEGDVIEVAGKSGSVERVTLRHIRIRDYDGSVHFIPNSMITVVTNRSRDYGYAVIDINIKREDDVEHAFELMRGVAQEMQADPVLGPLMLDKIDISGVEKVEDATVSLRCRLRTQPGNQARVRREFLRRLKVVMDKSDEVQTAA